MLKKKKTMKKFNKKSEPIKKTIYRLNTWLQIAPRPNIQMISQLDLMKLVVRHTYLAELYILYQLLLFYPQKVLQVPSELLKEYCIILSNFSQLIVTLTYCSQPV